MADFLNFIIFCFLVFSFLAPLGASQGKRLMTAALFNALTMLSSGKTKFQNGEMNMFYILS